MNDRFVALQLFVFRGPELAKEFLWLARPVRESIESTAEADHGCEVIVRERRALELRLDMIDRAFGRSHGHVVLRARKSAIEDDRSSIGQDLHVPAERARPD
jgi:hypothetical protein